MSCGSSSRFRAGSAAPETRGLAGAAVRIFVVTIARAAAGSSLGLALPRLARAFEAAAWKKKGLSEGWLRVTRQALAGGALGGGRPGAAERSLLLIHGTFSNAAAAFKDLAASDFFSAVAPLYGDRIFAFDHFTLSRTPEENARMLLEGLPDKPFTFDAVSHSRGGLVLRTLVERRGLFGPLASRFTLGRAVLVASPNEGTPLATPHRWEDTVGWIANLLELCPDNPFTTGAEFVANGLVWMARHASGDLPGLGSMDGDGREIAALQSPPGPPPDAYSALVANYNPEGGVLRRLLDIGVDQFFGSAHDLVVPAEGGWRVDRAGSAFIPGSRIGCFGPGGNLPGDAVTHTGIFARPETAAFLADALAGRPHRIPPMDPAKSLPDRRLLRAGAQGVATPVVTAGMRPAPARRARMTGEPGGQTETAGPPAHPFEITVVNGDLSFERLPLMVGHYHSARLTGAERVIDRMTGGVMQRSLDLGAYPVEPGACQVFLNTHVAKDRAWLSPRPEAVIVVGLGQEGGLRASYLAYTVRQGVIAWAQRVAERDRAAKPPAKPLRLSATLIGSGGSGVTVGEAARLIAQGVHEANELLGRDAAAGRALPLVQELRLVELYLDRANEAWRALRMQAEATPGRFVVAEPVAAGSGTLPRPLDAGYRGADYDYITAQTLRDVKGETWISYALDTTRARTEVRAQAAQSQLLKDLIATASNDRNADERIGQTLFRLLVPVELEAFLAGSTETQIELDEETARIPWELVDDGDRAAPGRLPWAIRAKLLRKFRTETFRERVSDADRSAGILVVGEPECPAGYPPLPGALQEARDVRDCLASSGAVEADRLTGLFAPGGGGAGPNARAVVNALFERPWRIVHIAGHGELASPDGGPGGVVLSNGTFVGPNEIRAMRSVPELVFINCCHLGAVAPESAPGPDGAAGARAYDRARFASSVAVALINIGVRCVVAAGWAVDDGAASAFATTFYASLLKRERFIDAVAKARAKAFELEGNTWAAYQCYGDPDWTFVLDPDAASRPSQPPSEHEFDEVATVASLKLALETLLVESVHQHRPPDRQRERARVLERRWTAMKWPASGGVAELFAELYAAVGDAEAASRWYDAAVTSPDGNVSFKAVEQRGYFLVRQAWLAVERAAAAREGARRRAGTGRALREAIVSARKVIEQESAVLRRLSSVYQEAPVGPRRTAERESLLGSAMKRLAMVEAAANRPGRERKAIDAMRAHYERALALVEAEDGGNAFYPAMNLIAADLAVHAGARGSRKLAPAVVDGVRRWLRAAEKRGGDFWAVSDEINLRLYEAVAGGSLAAAADALTRSYTDLSKRVQGQKDWGSVYDTAQFVLSRYAGRTRKAAERKAVRQVLDLLRRLAGPPDGAQ